MVKSLFVPVALLGLWAGGIFFTPRAARAAAPAPPAWLIDKPGSYALDHDIVVAGGDAIMVTASGVTLDLGGHNIACSNAGQGRGIVVDHARGVHVTNGKVHHFGVNVLLDTGENVTADGLQIVGANLGLPSGAQNAGDPRGTGGGFAEVGILLIDERGAVVRNDTITGVAAGIFNRGGNAVGSRFEGNTITGGPNAANDILAICFNPLPSEGTTGPSACLTQGNHVGHYNIGFAYQGMETGNITRNNTLAVWGSPYFYPDAFSDNNKKNTTSVNDTVVTLGAP